jgi:hypothetical protein
MKVEIEREKYDKVHLEATNEQGVIVTHGRLTGNRWRRPWCKTLCNWS